MEELVKPIVITVVAAVTISLITILTRWIIRIIRTNRIVGYMDRTINVEKKFRSKFFDTASLSSEVNLSNSEVEKLCTHSKKIKRITSYGDSWVLRKNYKDGDEVPPNHQLL